jgi:hypothetical protein
MTILNEIPQKFESPSAWVGADLQTRQNEWLYTLSVDDIFEIEHAARNYLSLRRDIGEITAQDFPLPQFSDYLQNMSEKLLHGIGVEVIRGLPIKSYSQEMAAAIFLALARIWVLRDHRMRQGIFWVIYEILALIRMIQRHGVIKPAHGKVFIQTAQILSR